MTEVAEGIAVLVAAMNLDQKCEHKPPDAKWQANLEGNSDHLTDNLWRDRGVPKPTTPLSVKQVSSRVWPSQAQHLIPWTQLKKHPVTQWLKETPPAGSSVLWADNDYSVNHGNNGKFMPYASGLTEWDGANAVEKEELVNTVMRAAGIQLHQGPHSSKHYGVGEDGYKSRVAEYLQRIHDNSLKHCPPCKDCEGKKQATKLPPRRNVVRFVDLASERLEIDINMGRIFVSRRAAAFVAGGGVTG